MRIKYLAPEEADICPLNFKKIGLKMIYVKFYTII